MSRLSLIAMLPAGLLAAPGVAQNLVNNLSLSEGVYGPTHWSLNRAADRRVDWYHAGEAHALRLNGTGEDWAGATSARVAVTPGEKLTVAAWVRTDQQVHDRDRLYVRFFSTARFLGQQGPALPAGAGAWTLVEATVTAPEGADFADLSLQIWSSGSVYMASPGLFRGEVDASAVSTAPPDAEFAQIDLPRGKPIDANENGLPDALEAALQVPADAVSSRRTRRKTTSFQTPTGYREDNDLKVDAIIVAANAEHNLQSWQDFGYEVHCMGGFRAATGYVELNPAEPQTDGSGTRLTCGPGSYYMVPTEKRRQIMAEYFAAAVRNGTEAVSPEEPEFFSRAGYSDAFKAEWQEVYGEPWQAPDSSVDARLKAERLKARMEQQLLTDIYVESRKVDPGVTRYLLAHSPLNYSAWGITFAHAAMLKTGLVDETVAQVWTGTARSHITHQGHQAERTFENAFLEYSSSWNLVRGLDIPVWFLMDPVEDNPDRPMEDYHRNYERTLAASLLFPEVDRFEVMPWPTRIFGRVPDDFATEITSVIRTLSDMQNQSSEKPLVAQEKPLVAQAFLPAAVSPSEGPNTTSRSDGGIRPAAVWDCGTQGIATFIADSAMYQRGDPSASDVRDIYGLCLPFLMKGIPAQIAHLDRAADPGYLDAYRALLVSYDAFKPESPEINEALADWTERGGTLLVFGGDDAYCEADSWWREAGFHGPTDHLLSLVGFDVSSREVIGEHNEGWTLAAETDYTGRLMENQTVEEIDLTPYLNDSDAVYVRFEDSQKDDGWGGLITRLELDGTQGGNPYRETLIPGSAAEGALIHDDNESHLNDGPARFTDALSYVVYRLPFDRGTRATLSVEIGNQYRILVSAAPPGTERIFHALPHRTDSDLWRISTGEPFVTYQNSGATPLITPVAQAFLPAAIGPLVLEKRVGSGRALFCGLAGRHFAASERGDRQLRALLRRSLGDEYREQSHIKLERGDYVIAKTFDGGLALPGPFIDILTPDLAVRTEVTLAEDSLAVLKRLRKSTDPTIAMCSSCAEWKSEEPTLTRMIVSDALGVNGVCRIYAADRKVRRVHAVTHSGDATDIAVTSDGPTILLRYPNQPNGIGITVEWE